MVMILLLGKQLSSTRKNPKWDNDDVVLEALLEIIVNEFFKSAMIEK